MPYEVRILKKVEKNLKKLPSKENDKLDYLIEDLIEFGPLQPKWPNFSKLGKNEYHCHLSRKWIACWRHEKNPIIIEVYYVGSRENAPY